MAHTTIIMLEYIPHVLLIYALICMYVFVDDIYLHMLGHLYEWKQESTWPAVYRHGR